MKERFLEIRFYYFIINLIKKFNGSIHVLDIIEAYCQIANIDSITIKTYMQQIRVGIGPLQTYKEEVVYIARELGISYRDLAKLTGISTSTQVRLLEYYKEHSNLYSNLDRKLPVDDYEVISKFMDVVDKVKEI